MNRVGHALLAAALLTSAPALCRAEAQTPIPGFVRLSSGAIRQDIRYAGAENFMGRPAPGYDAPECWLRQAAALALARVASDLAASGWRLVVYDCYRPKRAVAAFARWANDPADQARKSDYYPDIDKRNLFALGYIARASMHSKGATVDAGAETAAGAPLDFGTPFDRFDPKSATSSGSISPQAAANRRRLVAAFARQGFANYAREWWHFGLADRGAGTAYDIPISAGRQR